RPSRRRRDRILSLLLLSWGLFGPPRCDGGGEARSGCEERARSGSRRTRWRHRLGPTDVWGRCGPEASGGQESGRPTTGPGGGPPPVTGPGRYPPCGTSAPAVAFTVKGGRAQRSTCPDTRGRGAWRCEGRRFARSAALSCWWGSSACRLSAFPTVVEAGAAAAGGGAAGGGGGGSAGPPLRENPTPPPPGRRSKGAATPGATNLPGGGAPGSAK